MKAVNINRMQGLFQSKLLHYAILFKIIIKLLVFPNNYIYIN